MTAEKRLAAGDPKGAQELAQQALDKKIGDRGAGAVHPGAGGRGEQESGWRAENFQKAIQATKDPKVVAWSHVYLGRILDMKEDREAAMNEYRAALDDRRRSARSESGGGTRIAAGVRASGEAAVGALLQSSSEQRALSRSTSDPTYAAIECTVAEFAGLKSGRLSRGERMKRAAIVIAVLGMCVWSFGQATTNRRRRAAGDGRRLRSGAAGEASAGSQDAAGVRGVQGGDGS